MDYVRDIRLDEIFAELVDPRLSASQKRALEVEMLARLFNENCGTPLDLAFERSRAAFAEIDRSFPEQAPSR